MMGHNRTWFFTATLSLTLTAGPAMGGDIRVWPRAVVTADTITLGDIAEIRGLGREEAGRLSRLVVHGAPRPGGSVLVRAGDIGGALSEAGVNLGDVRVFGASRCKVFRPRPPRTSLRPSGESSALPKHKPVTRPPKLGPAGRGLPADSLEAVLREYITARVPHDDGRVDIRFSPVAKKDLALRGPDFRFVIHPQERQRLGLLSYEVSVRRRGEEDRTVSVAAEVSLIRDVVVARRTINRGRIIAGRDLKLEERRFVSQDAIGLTDLTAAVGLLAARFIKSGEMLDARSLQARPLVRRGDSVRILVRADGLEIRTTGKAQEAGALGDLITSCRGERNTTS
ncbi:MAG: flagellar basal body P-ring formation chaperone FlgA [Phycisphaerae bacterium]